MTPGPAPDVAGKLVGTRVACGDGPDCILAGILLPRAERLGSIPLLVLNLGPVEAHPATVHLEATGERTGGRLTETELRPQFGGPPVGPAEIEPLDFAVPAGLVPDHYTGQAVISFAGVDKPVVADVDLTIRQGPTLPLAELALGVVLGIVLRLVRSRVIPRGDLASRLMKDLNRTHENVLPSRDARAVEGWLALVQQDFKTGGLSEVESALTRIETALGLFASFASLALGLGSRRDAGAAKARDLIEKGRMDLAQSAAKDDALQAAAATYQLAWLAALEDIPSDTATTLVLEAPDVATEPTPMSPAATAKALARDGIPAGRLSWWTREAGIVRVLLVLMAFASGVLALYVAPAAGFIGGGFADAATLLLWGLGSSWVDKVIFDWG